MQELTLAVVGIDFPNANGSNRRFEGMMTIPGEPVALVLEPKNKHDGNAIAVISPRGVQLGYVNAERAPYIGGRISRGEDVLAIFQGIEGESAFIRVRSAFIRVRFGGEAPTLPPLTGKPAAPARAARAARSAAPHDPHAFYPDEEGPEWGA